MKKVIFKKLANKQYNYWLKTNKKIVSKIDTLIFDIQEHPFTGLGKPEPLKGELSGYWSRRITEEHRLVYTVENDIIIVQCMYHY